MAPDRRRPPTRDRRTFGIVSAGGFDIPRITPKTARKQAALRRSDFARDIVFAEFGYHNARAIDYGHLTDRKPHQGPRALLGG